MSSIRSEVRAAGKWKMRSEETHRDTHALLFQGMCTVTVPVVDRQQSALEQVRTVGASQQESIAADMLSEPDGVDASKDTNDLPPVVLVGNSAIERFKTTGTETAINKSAMSPSVTFIGDSMMERLKTTGTTTRLNKSAMPKSGVELPRSMNLGVGGDKIENLLFRLAGTDQPGKSLDAPLWDLFEDRKQRGQYVKLWVLQIGTNSLRPPRGGLRPKEMALYELVVKALLELGGQDCKVLCTGLFFRLDVEDATVTASNGEIAKLVASMNEAGEKRVSFMPASSTIDKTKHLDDHVHLNGEGYRLWDEAIVPEVLRLLGE